MSAGELRERVSILVPIATSDGQGGKSIEWVDLITQRAGHYTRLPASVVPAGGKESLAAAAISATTNYVVKMRYRATIDETMRVLWRPYRATADTTLEIHSVSAFNGGRAYIVMPCSVT